MGKGDEADNVLDAVDANNADHLLLVESEARDEVWTLLFIILFVIIATSRRLRPATVVIRCRRHNRKL